MRHRKIARTFWKAVYGAGRTFRQRGGLSVPRHAARTVKQTQRMSKRLGVARLSVRSIRIGTTPAFHKLAGRQRAGAAKRVRRAR